MSSLAKLEARRSHLQHLDPRLIGGAVFASESGGPLRLAAKGKLCIEGKSDRKRGDPGSYSGGRDSTQKWLLPLSSRVALAVAITLTELHVVVLELAPSSVFSS